MKRFGSAISYLMTDLISIYRSCGEERFIEERDRYLASQRQWDDLAFYRQLDYGRMAKIAALIDRYLDSVTCENEMKMELFFHEDQPAFLEDEVNPALFDFSYADKIYRFARENGLDVRIHTVLWYRHVPVQLKDCLEGRTPEDRKRLTLKFIRYYMQCLRDRYPDAYCVDVINEMAADPDELRGFREEGLPEYAYDDEGIRIDFWYRMLGRYYYIEVFRLAREVFGDRTKLFYNDNNEGNREKQRTYRSVIERFRRYEREHGVRLLDGFGMQCHFWGSEEETGDFMDDMFSFYADLGVELQITEFDVSCHSTKEVQNAIFESFAQAASRHGVGVFTVWGLNDIVSWLHGEEATLADENCDLKPFAMKYIEAFSRKYAAEEAEA